MRDFVETGFDVAFHDPLVATRTGREETNLGHRVMSPAFRAETVGTRQKLSLENRLQHQLQRCLDHPIRHGGDGCFILTFLQSLVGIFGSDVVVLKDV